MLSEANMSNMLCVVMPSVEYMFIILSVVIPSVEHMLILLSVLMPSVKHMLNILSVIMPTVDCKHIVITTSVIMVNVAVPLKAVTYHQIFYRI